MARQPRQRRSPALGTFSLRCSLAGRRSPSAALLPIAITIRVCILPNTPPAPAPPLPWRSEFRDPASPRVGCLTESRPAYDDCRRDAAQSRNRPRVFNDARLRYGHGL